MSFPKAKIHRYYDEISCAPPPGKYDPKFETKVIGAVIEKSKRFSESKLEERSLSMESINSSSSVKAPEFRTPKVNTKKLVSTPRSTSRLTKSSSSCKSRTALNYSQSSVNDQSYINQLNELTQVHSAQLLEKNEEINQLLYQINTLNEKIKEIESHHKLEEKNLKSDYISEVNQLRKDLYEAQASIDKEKEEYQKKLSQLEAHNLSLDENNTSQLNIIQNLEKSIADKDALFKEFNDKVLKISEEFDQQVGKFFNLLKVVDEVNRTLMEDYKSTLETLEKEKLINFEQKFTIETLEENLSYRKDEINQVLKKCKRYEVAQNGLQKTIAELGKRLMESEFEVEHLNEIQSDLVYKKSKLDEEIKTLSEENERIKNSMDYLQESVILDVQALQVDLMNKVQAMKNFASEESEKQNKCIQELQKANEVLSSEVDYYLNMKKDLQQEITFCHSKISNQQDEIQNLKITISEMEADFQDKISAQKALFNQLSNDHEVLNDCFNKEKEAYENKISHLSIEKEKNRVELEGEIDYLKSLCSRKEEIIKQSEEISFENEKKIEELALKLDHYNDCAQKSNRRIENLLQLSEAKDEQIAKLEERETEKDLKLQSLTEEIDQSKAYVQTVTEHVVSLVNELTDRESQIEQLNHEIEMKNATLIQISEEYDKIKIMYENGQTNYEQIEIEMAKMKEIHEQYMDEVISELVLEKERVSELNCMVELLKTDKLILEEKIDSISTNEIKHLVSEKSILEKELADQMEKLQLLEYERIAREFSIEDLLEHRDDLLGVITRQNTEIEILSETTDRHFCEIQELNKDKLEKMDEFHLLLGDLQNAENLCDKLNEKLQIQNYEINSLKLERDQSVNVLKHTIDEKNELLAKLIVLEEQLQETGRQLEGINRLKSDLVNLEDKIREKDKIILENSVSNVHCLKEELSKISDEKELLRDQNNELSMKVTSLEAQISDLECRNKEQLDIIGPFREQLVQFELERSQLLSKTKNTEKELKALELEHAKMLGHQNHKQKIKYIVQLTQTISDLKKENEKFRSENLKLRSDMRSLRPSSLVRNKDKENSLGAEQKNKTKPERTVSPANALRDRN